MADEARFIGGRIRGGYSTHESFDPSKCPTGGRCHQHGRCVDCCGVEDDRDIIECQKCGKQWSESCSFDEEFS